MKSCFFETDKWFSVPRDGNGNIHRNPPSLIFRQHLCGRLPLRLVLEKDVGELLAAVVAHDKASVQLIDGPGRREAADHHSRQPRCLGKYKAKNQTLSLIKIGKKISANRYARGQGRTSATCKAAISIPTRRAARGLRRER
jgi:hypothetical protein